MNRARVVRVRRLWRPFVRPYRPRSSGSSQRDAMAGAARYLQDARQARDRGELAVAVGKLIDCETFVSVALGLDLFKQSPVSRRYTTLRRIADAERARLVHAIAQMERREAAHDGGAVPIEVLDDDTSTHRGVA